MDFEFSLQDEAFRAEVRDWLEREPPGQCRLEIDDEGYGMWGVSREFSRRLGEKRWLAPEWPRQYGGQGRSMMEKLVLIQELASHRAPAFLHFGVELFGPAIMRFGTEEQRQRFMPPLARGDKIVCEGFSEPGAGSDAVSIKTRAVPVGGDFIISGQKVWTTFAQFADYCWITAITNPDVPPYQGLSMFIIDIKTPGITVRPLIDMTGELSFNEVYFDNVRVPASCLLGEINKGWPALLTALDSERCWTRAGMPWYLGEVLKDLVRYVRETGRERDNYIRQKLAGLGVEIEICRLLQYRVAWMQSCGIIPNYESSMVKVTADELGQKVARAGMEIMGLYGQLTGETKWAPLHGHFERMYLNSFGRTLAGGTSEIQRIIIATRGLKLPRR